MSTRPPPVLSQLEARVVAVLFEKRRTVPDVYPLTLNALVAGCNQKTSRDPVMEATPAQVQAAVDRLRALSLVIESSGGRAMRYAENIRAVLQVPSESVALLVTLMLRGPQTVAELRSHSERMQTFSDFSALEGFLHELQEWSAGAMVVELARQTGERERRWAHLLCGPVSEHAQPPGSPVALEAAAPVAAQAEAARRPPGSADLEIERLERKLASLAEALESLGDRVARLEGGAGRAPGADQE